jgi:hypothetical protein
MMGVELLLFASPRLRLNECHLNAEGQSCLSKSRDARAW